MRKKKGRVPDGDVGAANVSVGGEFDAVLGHGDDHGVADATQIPATQTRCHNKALSCDGILFWLQNK